MILNQIVGEKELYIILQYKQKLKISNLLFLIRFGVSGYPTIMYYKKSVKPIAYNGGRTQETITE